MQIEILLFDGFDELDVFGPFEGLADTFDTALVTLEGEREVVAARGVPVRAARALGARPDVLIVPGGGWLDRAPDGAWAEAQRGEIPAAIAERHAAGTPRSPPSAPGRCCSRPPASSTGAARRPTRRRSTTSARRGTIDVIDARVVDDGDVVTAGRARAAGSTSRCTLLRAPRRPRPRRGRRARAAARARRT